MKALATPAAPTLVPRAGERRLDLAAGELPAGLDHERLAVVRGERSGATMAVAIHSTRLGPALGGMRVWHYPREAEAVADALRLAKAMTYKAAAAGLQLGGGKGVVCAPAEAAPTGELRRAILLDFADLVESLAGAYITAEDIGTSAQDMVVIRSRTAHVSGMPVADGGAGDPSPFTAAGVQAAIRATSRHAFGTRAMRGRSVAVVGLGHVGERLARGLAADGARLLVSDIASQRRGLAAELGATWVEPGEALTAECDVLAPCAVGGAINEVNVGRLRCRAICGAANNQLESESLARNLAEAGVLYAPDFIANAGGLINVYRELHAYTAERAMSLALGIEGTMDRVIAVAADRGVTPLDAARELAEERLDAALA